MGGKFVGRHDTTAFIASVPPVEAPMVITSRSLATLPFATVPAEIGVIVGALATFALAAALTFSIKMYFISL